MRVPVLNLTSISFFGTFLPTAHTESLKKIRERGLCRALFSQTFFRTVSCCASPWKRRALLTDDFEQPTRLAIAGTEPSSITRIASSFLSRSFACVRHVGIIFLLPLRFHSPSIAPLFRLSGRRCAAERLLRVPLRLRFRIF